MFVPALACVFFIKKNSSAPRHGVTSLHHEEPSQPAAVTTTPCSELEGAAAAGAACCAPTATGLRTKHSPSLRQIMPSASRYHHAAMEPVAVLLLSDHPLVSPCSVAARLCHTHSCTSVLVAERAEVEPALINANFF